MLCKFLSISCHFSHQSKWWPIVFCDTRSYLKDRIRLKRLNDFCPQNRLVLQGLIHYGGRHPGNEERIIRDFSH